MGSSFRLRLALGQALYPSGTGPFLTSLTGGEVFVDIAVGLFLMSLALVSARRLLKSGSGVVMAWLAMPTPGGSALSGALQAAAGRGSHALPAAASALSRRFAAKTDAGRRSC